MSTMFFYFDIEYAVKTHDWIIENSGGSSGSINKFHAFADGNKRSSIALGAYFLELNGYSFIIEKFVLEMENIAVWLAEGKVSKELLGELIKSLIFEEEFSEGLKLKLAIAVMVLAE